MEFAAFVPPLMMEFVFLTCCTRVRFGLAPHGQSVSSHIRDQNVSGNSNYKDVRGCTSDRMLVPL